MKFKVRISENSSKVSMRDFPTNFILKEKI
jgi:hypothetical protein